MGSVIVVDFKTRKVVDRISERETEVLSVSSLMSEHQKEMMYYQTLRDLEKELIIDALSASYSIREASLLLEQDVAFFLDKVVEHEIETHKYLRKV